VAGHPPPVALDTGEPVGELESPGMPLGIEIDLGGTLGEVPLSPGEGVLLYTDGLIEARSAGIGILGEERVRERLANEAGATADHLASRLGELADGYSEVRRRDDLALLIARVVPG
jgi:phosphoserine phosphatase RsbU/P